MDLLDHILDATGWDRRIAYVPTVLHPNLLGWYDNHDDPVFNQFKADAMWSMCQRYYQYPGEEEYRRYMLDIADTLGRKVSAHRQT